MPELSLAAVDMLWEDLGLGEVPFPLQVRGFGETLEERARIKAGVYADLERRGLANAGRPAPSLETVLNLLARPELSVDLVARLEPGGNPVNAVAVGRGKRAVRAVQRHDDIEDIELTEVRDTAVVASIVELLPASRPGPGRSVTVPAAALNKWAAREHRSELRLIASIMGRPVLRVGQLGAGLRDDRGGLRRLPGIAWFDTDQGRYATTVRRGADGADWATLSPTDNARLAHRLSEMLGTYEPRLV